MKGVGPTVIARLEQLGYASLEQLAGAQVQDIVKSAAALVGSTCWKNSAQARSAIEGAIIAAACATRALTSGPTDSADLPDKAIGELERLANLGPKSAAILAGAAIQSADHLARLGSVAAFAMAKRSGARVSINLLWAIEGALCGQSWQTVARKHRASLLLALDSHEVGK